MIRKILPAILCLMFLCQSVLPAQISILGIGDGWLASTNLMATTDDRLYILRSTNGLSWNYLTQPGSPVYSPESPDTRVRDPDILFHNNTYWVAFNNAATTTTITIVKSTDKLNWSLVCRPDFSLVPDCTNIWCPRWFVDDDNSIHIIAAVAPSSGLHQLYEIHSTAADLSTWSDPVLITLTGAWTPSQIIDQYVIARSQSIGPYAGKYIIWFPGDNRINYMYATSLTGPYTVNGYNPYEWDVNVEGTQMIRLIDGVTWRLYYTHLADNSWWYRETTDWLSWTDETAANFLRGQFPHPHRPMH